MGRGRGWGVEELANLARAWVYASGDSIVGIDRTAARFMSTMFHKFKILATAGATLKSYGGRAPASCRRKMDQVAADCRKFRECLRYIRACRPTGVTEDQIISMAIGKHLGTGD